MMLIKQNYTSTSISCLRCLDAFCVPWQVYTPNVFHCVNLNLQANLIMYKESSEYPDLISGSKHLLHSDFMRSFISAIDILEYLGNTRPSPIEFASPTFFPNTSNDPWRPWFHIYSMCKAGKGQKHNPQINTLGKTNQFNLFLKIFINYLY